jgi:predicted permease
LWLLPRSFRERFGDELAETAGALAAEARRTGGRGRQWQRILRELAAVARLAISLRRGRRVSLERGRSGRRAMWTTGLDELGWALRHTRRRPAFALTVTATLALSIGAATAAFGLATAVLWRELPFHDASGLVFVWEESERDGQAHASRVTGARYAAWRDARGVFASLALFGAAGFTLETRDGTMSLRGVRVSAGYFDTLGIRPVLGRGFRPADDTPGAHRVVVLSSHFWRQQLGGRRDVIGETLRLNGEPHTVVGVMPAVTFPAWPVNPAAVTLEPESRQVWVPIPRTAALDQGARAHVFGVVGRLAKGVEPGDATTRLNFTSDPSTPDPHRARLAPFRAQFVGDARTPLLLLAAATLAILLIACANLAALYTSAYESRRGELSVRIALGAGPARLVRQLSMEALLLASAAAAGGVAIARAALLSVSNALPPSFPLLTTPSVDLRVVAFAAGLAFVAALMLTSWPVARLLRAAPSPRGVVAPSRGAVYRWLVVCQVAASVALAVAGGLLWQSLAAVRRQDPGFSLERTLVAEIGLAGLSNDAGLITQAEQRVLAAAAALPRVTAVGAAYDHPLEANWSEAPTVLGDAGTAGESRPAELRIVSPGYFEALDVEVLDGRALTERDAIDSPGVTVVNEAFAHAVGGRVLGRRLRTGTPRLTFSAAPDEFEIVGVVKSERVRGLEQPAQPAFYLSTRQFPQTGFAILVRTEGDPLAMAADLRSAILAAGPAITFERPTSLERILADQLVSRRVTTDLIGGFAGAAIGLAALGMYGLLVVLVSSRRREIGVRLALGARPASVARLVLFDSLRNAALGVVLGSALSVITGRLIQSLLVDVSPADPMTLAMVVSVLLAVAVAAAVVPAFRAARIDPADALRADG